MWKKFFLKIKTKKNSEWKINFMKKMLLDWGLNHKTAKCLTLKPGALAHKTMRFLSEQGWSTNI